MGPIETKIDILNGFNLEYLSINGTKKSLARGDFHFENLLFNGGLNLQMRLFTRT